MGVDTPAELIGDVLAVLARSVYRRRGVVPVELDPRLPPLPKGRRLRQREHARRRLLLAGFRSGLVWALQRRGRALLEDVRARFPMPVHPQWCFQPKCPHCEKIARWSADMHDRLGLPYGVGAYIYRFFESS